jgi:hypothetical protein
VEHEPRRELELTRAAPTLRMRVSPVKSRAKRGADVAPHTPRLASTVTTATSMGMVQAASPKASAT